MTIAYLYREAEPRDGSRKRFEQRNRSNAVGKSISDNEPFQSITEELKLATRLWTSAQFVREDYQSQLQGLEDIGHNGDAHRLLHQEFGRAWDRELIALNRVLELRDQIEKLNGVAPRLRPVG